MKNYYKILDVSPTAPDQNIRAAFRIKAKMYHPDVHLTNQAYYQALFVEAHEAYEILSDPVKRKEYDVKYGRYYSIISDKVVVREQVFKQNKESAYFKVKSSIPFLKHIVEVSDSFIRYDSDVMPIAKINAVRAGWSVGGLFQDDYTFIICFKSIDDESLVVHFNPLFKSVNYKHEKFNEVLASIYYYVLPKLISRKITELDDLISFKISEKCSVSRMGVTAKKKYFIPWTELQLEERKHGGPFFYKTDRIVISSRKQPSIKVEVRPIEHWNAILLPSILQYYRDGI